MKQRVLKIPPYNQKITSSQIHNADSEGSEEDESSADSELAEYEFDTPTVKYQLITFTSVKDFNI